MKPSHNDALVHLALAYSESSCDEARRELSDEISRFLLNSSLAKTMVRSMLHQKKKSPERMEDALQDVAVLFVMKVLPQLRDPQASWGALRGTVGIVGRRIGGSFYDGERGKTSSLSQPPNTREDDEQGGESLEAIIQLEHALVDETEGEILDKIVADQAKMTINEALMASKMKGGNALRWLKRLNHPQEVITLPHKKQTSSTQNMTLREVLEERGSAPKPTTRIVPVAILARTSTATPSALEEMPNARQEKQENRKAAEKIPVTKLYQRLVEIRDLSGIAIGPFAEALHIGVPRLRSYLSRKSNVHPEVLARAEQWYQQEGKLRHKRLKKLKEMPLPELIEQWKDMTGSNSYAALADIMGISVPTITRWRKPDYKPMHDSHLLEAEDKVNSYCAGRKRKR